MRRSGSSATLSSLSAREHDVLRLLAEGLSNEGISNDLHLAVKTVEAAVRSIFNKLDLLQDSSWNRRVLAATWFLQSVSPEENGFVATSTGFVGRDAELIELEHLLNETAFVTLTGPGGIGKTRLALQLAKRVSTRYRIRFIDLAAVDEPSVTRRVFDAFGLQLVSPRAGVELLRRIFRDDDHLVVLDNAEHVLPALTDILGPLTSSPTSRLVVTSREPMNVSGEHVWRVPPLSAADSTRLLTDRLAGAGMRGSVAADVLDAWCNALDGIPLAVELAAGRLASLPANATDSDSRSIASLLDGGGTRRHASLGGIIAESLARLRAPARDLARSLSVFRGGFTLSAARSVSRGGDGDLLLAQLVSSSLVEFNGSRYRMLEPVRQFTADGMVAAERAHAELALVNWCIDFNEQAGPGFLHEPRDWRPRIEAELDNIDAALDAASRRLQRADALRIARVASQYWGTGAAAAAYQRVAQLVAGHDDDTSLEQAWGHTEAGRLASYTRLHDEAIAHLRRAQQLFELHSDGDGVTVTTFWLARVSGSTEELLRAAELARAGGHGQIESWTYLILARNGMRHLQGLRPCLELLDRAERIAINHQLPQLVSDANLLRAQTMLQANWVDQGRYAPHEIDALLTEVQEYNRHAGGAEQVTDYLSIATTTHLHQRRWRQARMLVRDQLAWSQRTEDPIVIAEAILMAAVVLAHDGHPDAIRVASAAGPTFAEWSGPLWLAYTVHPQPELYAAIPADGETMTTDDLVQLAGTVEQLLQQGVAA
jgi:predicted ATPase/DNA-binding CsgD family transcriptional regulator